MYIDPSSFTRINPNLFLLQHVDSCQPRPFTWWRRKVRSPSTVSTYWWRTARCLVLKTTSESTGRMSHPWVCCALRCRQRSCVRQPMSSLSPRLYLRLVVPCVIYKGIAYMFFRYICCTFLYLDFLYFPLSFFLLLQFAFIILSSHFAP